MESRNNLIIDEISKDIDSGHFTLILSDRVKHNKFLYENLKRKGFNVILIIGENRKENNWEDIQSDETLQGIIATSSIASEGLNIPRLSSLHLPCPSSNLPRLKQKIGRIRRVYPGKKFPVVRDYVDNLGCLYEVDEEGNKKEVYLLRYTAKKREKYYIQLQREYDA
jgi:superfamily II DNA or RNA helicase